MTTTTNTPPVTDVITHPRVRPFLLTDATLTAGNGPAYLVAAPRLADLFGASTALLVGLGVFPGRSRRGRRLARDPTTGAARPRPRAGRLQRRLGRGQPRLRRPRRPDDDRSGLGRAPWPCWSPRSAAGRAWFRPARLTPWQP
ncbi:hypothetical protein [Nocardioides sp. B-3]|uniref:hypothetical protein n=1 Tax=Nocardioides sp. B-3 TaxID=2895565 RepID=UPI002153615B|nr:hypothetical protein [Nocardioides sp. B-3]UUZ59349.1 hypothetical protein LP418_26470 [Nocardioides sp. B-3]